ncbi:MAG: radical SAM protein [Firmicutes bacterium]|jgi:DNA repair photolyase|nr:radical SAM protein [Bacillota bacterium]
MKILVHKRKYEVIKSPQPHILVPTRKQLHGWWPGKRECTSERMLINPYNGCGIGCFFCYARAFPGYFRTFRDSGVITVAKDFDQIVAEQLDSIDIAACGYLSPVTDPFQSLNAKYHLSEKIIRVFVERNIPIEFITKAPIPEEVIDLIKQQSHSFGQVSILTLKEDLRKILVPRGASTDLLLQNLEKLTQEGIFAVCRIDPIFPYVTDKIKELVELIERIKSHGVSHIVTSILDIPLKIKRDVFSTIKKYFGVAMEWDYQRLYRENINGYLNADISYRKRIFDGLRNACERKNLTFALCMEYELEKGEIIGLNQEFMSSRNCEGIDIPLYKREGKKFYPAVDCTGDCLYCTDPRCGIEDLAMGRESSKKDWRLKDYRQWSKEAKRKSSKMLFPDPM